MRLSQQQTGSMLLSVLFLILLLSVFMAGMAMLSSQSSQQLIYEVQSIKARLDAESILEKQVYKLLDNIDATEVESEGVYNCKPSIKITPPSDNEGLKQVAVTATGTCEQGLFTVTRNITVEVVVER